MSRRNSILIILAVIVLIIGGLLFFYFSSIDTTKSTLNLTPTGTTPFGGVSPDRITDQGAGIRDVNEDVQTVETSLKLTQIYKNPTSGSVFLKNNEKNVLRFVDRAVGNVYEYVLEDKTGEIKRITNTTIPKIQEAIWSTVGDSLVLRYLENDTDTISSFSAKIKSGSSSPAELSGVFLTSNIKHLAVNPKGDRLFMLLDKSDKSGTYGFITNLDGTGKKTVFDSPILYLNASWPKDDTITLTTKSNYKDTGLMYFLNTQNSSISRIMGNINGISTITNKNANLVAYSYNTESSFYLDIYDVLNKTSGGLRIPTLADKCVWGNNNPKILYCALPKTIAPDNYPDAWYQGLVSFSDDIWKINTENGVINQIYEIGSNETVNIDSTDLKISLDDKYLSFSNKNDLSLWLLEL